MKKRELIGKMQDEINVLSNKIVHLENQKATWEYVYKLEHDMIHADQKLLDRIIKLEEKAECECVQAHAMPEADIVCNSHKQVNNQNDDYKDRCDVNKAFWEWRSDNHTNVPIYQMTSSAWLKFAVYFAERVKGGKL